MKEIIKLMSLQQIAGRLRRHEPKKITGLELDRMKKFKMIRDELKFDYTINFVYISSIETFFLIARIKIKNETRECILREERRQWT